MATGQLSCRSVWCRDDYDFQVWRLTWAAVLPAGVTATMAPGRGRSSLSSALVVLTSGAAGDLTHLCRRRVGQRRHQLRGTVNQGGDSTVGAHQGNIAAALPCCHFRLAVDRRSPDVRATRTGGVTAVGSWPSRGGGHGSSLPVLGGWCVLHWRRRHTGLFGGCGRHRLVVHWIYRSSALWLCPP